MEAQQDLSYPGLKKYAKEMGTYSALLIEAFHLEGGTKDYTLKEAVETFVKVVGEPSSIWNPGMK